MYPLGHLFHKGVYALLEAFNLGGCAAANIRLHSTINILIRVELRTVGRQEKQLNAIFMSLDPLCYGLALVDTQIVDDQIDFSRLVFYQIFKKFNECFREYCRKRYTVPLKTQLIASIREGNSMKQNRVAFNFTSCKL